MFVITLRVNCNLTQSAKLSAEATSLKEQTTVRNMPLGYFGQ